MKYKTDLSFEVKEMRENMLMSVRDVAKRLKYKVSSIKTYEKPYKCSNSFYYAMKRIYEQYQDKNGNPFDKILIVSVKETIDGIEVQYKEVVFSKLIPFKIRKGYPGTSKRSWFFYTAINKVYGRQYMNNFIHLNLPTKGFTNLKTAIATGMEIYKAHLHEQLSYISTFEKWEE